MKRFACPRVAPYARVVLAFLLAELLLLTGTWQLAFLAGFVSGMFSRKVRWAILFGGGGVLLAWAAYLVYAFVAGAGGAVASLFGSILGVGGPWLLTGLTLVLGFLVGGVGGLTGSTGAALFLWEQPPLPTAEVPKDS